MLEMTRFYDCLLVHQACLISCIGQDG